MVRSLKISKWISILLFCLLFFSYAQAQDSLNTKRSFNEVVNFNGYLKFMETSAFTDFDNFLSSSLIHNRLNFKIYANDNFTFKADFRNRIIWGNYVKEVPGFIDGFTADNGLVDLSINWVEDSAFVFNTTIDRFWADYKRGDFAVRVGRQRINWGINYVWNPNDLFNAFNYFDFDYEERPGTDALRVQYFTGGMSAIDIGINPAKDAKDAVYAGQYRFNVKGYDIQLLGGYYHDRIAVGGGFAGNLGTAAIKGEGSYFSENDSTNASFSGALDFQYGFKNGINLLFSYLYNSAGSNSYAIEGQTSLFYGKPAADNLMPSKHTAFGDISYAFTPLFTGDLGAMYTFGFNVIYIMPNLTYSIVENLDLNLVGQFFVALEDVNGISASSNFVYIRFKWSF
jgi:hypothetical protein